MTCRISRFQDGGSLSNYIRTTIFLAEGIRKVHIFRHSFVCFQTSVYTLGEFHKNRNNSIVFEELSVSILWTWRRKYPFYWLRFASPVKLHLRPSNPQLTPPTLQIRWKHTNEWRNICTFRIPSAKKIVVLM
jgi:hypothetical protein